MPFRIILDTSGVHVEFSGSDKNAPERKNKGASLIEKCGSFVSIDIETTGLSTLYDEIIELGGVRFRDGQPAGSFSQLVKPKNEIDEFIEEMTGITNEMLADAPALPSVLPAFLDFVGDDILVGHNVHFDVNFIYDACAELNLTPFSNNFIDTMRVSRRLYPNWPNHKLDTILKELGIETRDLHRAENDARLTGLAYLAMTQNPNFDTCLSYVRAPGLRAKDIQSSPDAKADEDNPLYNRVCVFTGTLESFTRREAMQLVVDLGGIVGDNVTKKTNYLVLGNNDYCKTIKDGKSSKQKKAEKLILDGADLQIIPEAVFMDMLSNE